MFCDGKIGAGWWIAAMAEAADAPDDRAGSDWGLPFDRPDTGSAFDDGQRPLTGFFRCVQLSRSA